MSLSRRSIANLAKVSLLSFRSSRPCTTFSFRRTMSSSAKASAGPLETSIREKLTTRFNPVSLKINNDSAAHSHHSAMRAADPSVVKTGETHFRVELVSSTFEGMKSIQRHRAVNETLKQEFEAGLHALQIKAKTPQEAEST